MSDKINFHKLRRPDSCEHELNAIHISSQAFTSQPDPAAATTELVRSLRKHCTKNQSFNTADNFLFYFWMTLLNAQRIIPIEHPWHEALIVAVDDLRRAGGPLVDNHTENLWGNLPGLSMLILDFWADFPDTTPEEIEDCKRWNSFVSGLVARGCRWWIVYGYYEIREALETASHDKPTSFDPATVFECKLWVATQWLIRCGGMLFQDATKSLESYTAQEVGSVGPGALCKDLPAFSIQRWHFRLSQLMELADRKSTTRLKDRAAHEVVMSQSSLSHVDQAIAAMHKWRSSADAESQSSDDKDSSGTP
ncbi:hypothetical protein N7493_007386 [Penicillium malachiteum]|uniref:Uncharacterized protein n=1 Tax=Penicillium malachiteum TaxID=1324776 RepID=A0AAD6HJ92_9EURO|nr:hypothetical protein N7493_007386 [Penicillium malachiteum]